MTVSPKQSADSVQGEVGFRLVERSTAGGVSDPAPFDLSQITVVDYRDLRVPATHVYLGEAGYPDARSEVSSMQFAASRHPRARFVSIDLGDFSSGLSNTSHRRNDFIDGLLQFEPGTVSLIRSEFALGYYNGDGERYVDTRDRTTHSAEVREHRRYAFEQTCRYTKAVIALAHRALRYGGALEVTVASDAAPLIREALAESTFSPHFIRELRRAPSPPSFWTRYFESQGCEVTRHVARKTG